jgi:hypothetical protein
VQAETIAKHRQKRSSLQGAVNQEQTASFMKTPIEADCFAGEGQC